ncbi:hypothetical protein Pmar_PMAR021605 [Perkinsus marinus ATCC 50983]|uniref:Uncharacterized protein n=1 Tax=Perkinsus marinus (strain ATCC 50983 / TXsc) TaxID=423536 RepID=C5L8L8_PERM5|nr:hypothetical protein Pmar_PMAR021605 [Perkinsus marinus ATCC 50983]EER06931.1 hypothetical protein Pmar_PMAR021605 [Perkinsus marinus ATCC 50983]|eukprot:XP_002775115.1 hypothetical protein Pmar_PMAR021605 [Perkinsus marinus ATCC 50983]
MQEENEVDADGEAAEDPDVDLQASKGPQYEIREAVEKCYVPADGSVIISTKFTRTSAIGKTPVDCDAGAEEKAMEEETLVAGEEGNDDDIQHEDEFNRELICSRRVTKAFVKGCTLRVGESYVSCVFEDSSRFTVIRDGGNGFVLMYTPLRATWVTLCLHQGIELKPQKVTFEKPLMRMVPNARCGDLVCDVERSRRVFPKGVIMRELTSGRKELLYPDGQ